MSNSGKRSVPPSPCSGEQRNGVAACFGSEHIGEVGKEGAALQAAGYRGREQPFDGALAPLGLAAERELAVDDRPAQAALGVIVGRLDAGDAGEGPQRRPALEQVVGEGAVAAVARRFARRLLEQRPELLLERADALAEAGAVSVPAALVPGGEQPLRDPKPGRAELLLGAEPLAVGGEVAHQVRESRAGVAAGRGSRKAHQRSAQATPESSSPSSACASRRWRSAAMRKTAARKVSAPLKRAPAAAQAPAGLVNVDGRGGADVPEEVLVGLVEGPGHALQDRRDRACGEARSEELAQKLCGVAPRDAVAHREGGDRRLQARAEGSRRHSGGQLGARRGAALRAAQALQAMLAEDDRGRRQLRDLMARGRPARRALRAAEHVAAAAAGGPVVEKLVERLDRRQMTTASRMARLGAAPALRGSSLPALRRGWRILAGGQRGVARVAVQAPLKLGDALLLLGEALAQLGDLTPEQKIGRREL